MLPPWVEYRKGEVKSIQVPFDTYFQVDALKDYHSVITMEQFMKTMAPEVWPASKRISFCYQARNTLDGKETNSCNAKEGNPFKSFWDTFDIDFVTSEFYGPDLNYDVHYRKMHEKWNEKYPPSEWPVLAFTGAPAIFPVIESDRHLQKYLKWSVDVQKRARDFIKTTLPKGAFIGIHLRNGMDWVRACEHVKDLDNLFASPQCLGYRNEKGALTSDICFPTKDLIFKKIKRVIKMVKEQNKSNEIKSIFVASDSNHMIQELNDGLKRMNVKAYKLPESDPHLDLAILGQSNQFIGNCVSSFTAFVKRERDANGFPSHFWAFPPEKSKQKIAHEEL